MYCRNMKYIKKCSKECINLNKQPWKKFRLWILMVIVCIFCLTKKGFGAWIFFQKKHSVYWWGIPENHVKPTLLKTNCSISPYLKWCMFVVARYMVSTLASPQSKLCIVKRVHWHNKKILNIKKTEFMIPWWKIS